MPDSDAAQAVGSAVPVAELSYGWWLQQLVTAVPLAYTESPARARRRGLGYLLRTLGPEAGSRSESSLTVIRYPWQLWQSLTNLESHPGIRVYVRPVGRGGSLAGPSVAAGGHFRGQVSRILPPVPQNKTSADLQEIRTTPK